MTTVNFPLILDHEAERKLALAKIYSILLKIAEKETAINPDQNNEKSSELLKENTPPAV